MDKYHKALEAIFNKVGQLQLSSVAILALAEVEPWPLDMVEEDRQKIINILGNTIVTLAKEKDHDVIIRAKANVMILYEIFCTKECDILEEFKEFCDSHNKPSH